MSSESTADVVLAVGEATSSAIQQANQDGDTTIRMRTAASCDRLVVEVSAEGTWAADADSDQGIGIMRALVAAVCIEHGEHHTSIRFEVEL